MPRSSECRPVGERDGVWYKDRFYRTPPRHYESVTTAQTESGQRPEKLQPPPPKFQLLEGLKSEELRHPFTMHDNQYVHYNDGETLRGRQKKRRPCCVRPLHADSDPRVFLDCADPPSSPDRLQTISRQSFLVPAVGSGAARGRRLFGHQTRCPFTDGSCRHSPPEPRRFEPASTAPAVCDAAQPTSAPEPRPLSPSDSVGTASTAAQ